MQKRSPSTPLMHRNTGASRFRIIACFCGAISPLSNFVLRLLPDFTKVELKQP